jgi:uncharacterized protein (TIGR03435 family)
MIRTIAALVVLSAAALAQTVSPPAFEVAAIKSNHMGDTGSHWKDKDGHLAMTNMSVKNIVIAAYGIQERQFAGPSGLANHRYTIDAKADHKAGGPEVMRMLQTLLADRFKLVVHREQKMMPGYALVAGKSIKMRASQGESAHSRNDGSKLVAQHLDMPGLARILERQIGDPVVDDTHLSGGYDFTLEYSVERRRPMETDALPSDKPSIFTALPEQLGLKLEGRKVPIEMLVVDRVEKPAEVDK